MINFEILRTPITSLEFESGKTQDGSRTPMNNLSYVRGSDQPELLALTIPHFLQNTLERFGNREAAVFSEFGIRWSYRQLAEEADKLATGLLALGMQKGDRVGIWAPNRPEWLLTQLATARIGLILVNINPAYRIAELEHALNLSGCKALISAESFKKSDYIGMINTLAPELIKGESEKIFAAKLPHLRYVIRLGVDKTPNMWNFDEICQLGGPAQYLRLATIDSTLDYNDVINIQFTSGTTGLPKGAMLSHYNIINNARYIAQAMNLTEADVLCIPVPLYHCFGMVLGNLACIAVGAKMVFPGESFDPKSVLDVVQKERCSALHGVPTMFVAELEHPDFNSYDLSSLRTGIMAGSPCPIEVMKRVTCDMHISEITIAYGMTETSPVSFQSAASDSLEKRVSTVGRVHPHVEVKIIDLENGTIVPVGERGELCTCGYSVMRGYWEDDDRTREAIDIEGWMHTGDLAILDEEGYCNIVGRVKDMLIRGGENIYPREIEEFLYRHPAVQEVQVFGVPDVKYGEEVAAWIVLKPGAYCDEETIRNFCREQIAHYKIPRYIRFVDEFPMTVTGKPQKFKMREEMNKLLGSHNE